MTHNTTTKTPEEQLKEYEEIKQDYEWLAKSNLEMIYKYGEGLSEAEIESLINQPDWKEKTQFGIGEGWGTTIGTSSKGIGYTTNRTAMHFCYKPIYLVSLREREIKMRKELTNQLASSQTIEEKTIDKWKQKFSQQEMEGFLTIKKEFEELKEKIKELTVFKEQIEDLEKKTVEILTKVKKEEDEEITYWEKGEPQELLENVKKGNLVQTVIRVIKKWKRDAKVHYESLGTSEIWNKNQKTELTKEVEEKSRMLQESDKMIEEEIAKNTKLQDESEEKSKMLAESEGREEELSRQLYLERKPLPVLPKKRNSFQKLGSKIKIKFQKLQQLVENKKHQTQEFIAQIEAKVN